MPRRIRHTEQRVLLPGGLVDEHGRAHVGATLGPVTGAVEESLAEAATGGASVAALTTELLVHTVRCIDGIKRVTAEVVRALLVQDRDYLLARIYAFTFGPEMWVRLDCAGCATELELRLVLHELPVVRRPAVARYFTFDDDIELRLPTGADQEWAASAEVSADDTREGLLARCVRWRGPHRRTLDGPLAERIEKRMSELAPDVTPEPDCVCPHCSASMSADVDVPFEVLCELVSSRRSLEQEVHMLAWHYHWHEADILAMSRTKRRRYIRLIEEQLEMGSAA